MSQSGKSRIPHDPRRLARDGSVVGTADGEGVPGEGNAQQPGGSPPPNLRRSSPTKSIRSNARSEVTRPRGQVQESQRNDYTAMLKSEADRYRTDRDRYRNERNKALDFAKKEKKRADEQTAELQTLKERTAILTKRLEESQALIAKLRNEKDRLGAEVRKIMVDELNEALSENGMLRKDIAQLKEEIQKLRKEAQPNAELKNQLNRCNMSRAAAEDRLKKVEGMKENYKEELAGRDKRIQKLLSELDGLRSQNYELRAERDRANRKAGKDEGIGTAPRNGRKRTSQPQSQAKQSTSQFQPQASSITQLRKTMERNVSPPQSDPRVPKPISTRNKVGAATTGCAGPANTGKLDYRDAIKEAIKQKGGANRSLDLTAICSYITDTHKPSHTRRGLHCQVGKVLKKLVDDRALEKTGAASNALYSLGSTATGVATASAGGRKRCSRNPTFAKAASLVTTPNARRSERLIASAEGKLKRLSEQTSPRKVVKDGGPPCKACRKL